MKRIQRKRAKGWRMPPGAKYVGRPTDLGNPYKVTKKDGIFWITGPGVIKWGFSDKISAIEACVNLYRPWLAEQIAAGRLNLEELRDHDLACFCPEGQPCHVDVILEHFKQD